MVYYLEKKIFECTHIVPSMHLSLFKQAFLSTRALICLVSQIKS